MADNSPAEQWEVIRHLHSLGMSQQEAEAWVKARQAGQPFKLDWSDGVGHQLDRVWKRNIERTILTRLPKRRSIIAILWAYSFAVWVYAVIFQMMSPRSLNWQLAIWLPWLKLSYVQGAALLGSLAFAATWFALRNDNANSANEHAFDKVQRAK